MSEYYRAANYCRAMVGDIKFILDRMVQIDKEVGHIWKWPDKESCILYALTESAEYIESQLFAARPNDSRNNKKAEDFDAATELFDVVMMLLRSLVASRNVFNNMGREGIEDASMAVLELFNEYTLRHMGDIFFDIEHPQKSRPQEIIGSISFLFDNYSPNMIFDLIVTIYANELFEHTAFVDVADKKLEKILEKNRSKMEKIGNGD